MIARVLFVLIADQFDPLVNLVEEQIFKKPLAWGQVMGFGSTCTSSWFAAIVSNTALVGAACMLQAFVRRSIHQTARSSELLTGMNVMLIPGLAMAGVDSAGPDSGHWMAMTFGAIMGIGHSVQDQLLDAALERHRLAA
jgi:hypothetical protein